MTNVKIAHTKEELHNMIATMYKYLITDKHIYYAGQLISSRREFIEAVGHNFGYRNVKNIIKEVK